MEPISKRKITIVCWVMAAIASSFFLVVERTSLFAIAYIFAILTIGVLGFGSVYMSDTRSGYPWLGAFTVTVWSYLIIQVIFSTVFIVAQNAFDWTFDTRWFSFIHVILLTFASVMLPVLKAGMKSNEYQAPESTKNVENKKVIFDLNPVVADLDAASEKMPSMRNSIKVVADALRHTDPLSHPLLERFEEVIKDSVALITQAVEKGHRKNVPDLCNKLKRQIEDRNKRLKILMTKK